MAIDPKPPVQSVDLENDSPIDNEVPAYRALSPLAIVSIVFGCASIFTFTSLAFAVFGVLAIVTGLLAQRRIRQLPDVLTGTQQANTGIALGLLFTLMAVTISGVHDWIYDREASKFAQVFVDTLKDGDLSDLVYLQVAPSSRKGKTPKQFLEEMRTGGRANGEFEAMNQGLIDLKKRTSTTASSTAEFVRIEGKNLEGMTLRAAALIKVGTGRSDAPPEDIRHALVEIQGDTQVPGYDWMVTKVTFPFQPKK